MIKRILKEKSDNSDRLFRMEFFCDGESDVAALPTQSEAKNEEKCATGSLAYILEPEQSKSRLRILASSGQWREVGV